jgi:hypothetical protein
VSGGLIGRVGVVGEFIGLVARPRVVGFVRRVGLVRRLRKIVVGVSLQGSVLVAV